MEGEHYQQYLDPVIAEFTADGYREEIVRARLEYLRATGEVHEDDGIFEERIASFFDWFVFDRPLDGKLRAPVQLFLLERRLSLEPPLRQIYEDFLANIHSVFLLRRRRPGTMLLKDLLSGRKHLVNERRTHWTLERGDTFVARLIPFRDGLYFSRGFCFFPRQVRAYVVKECKRARKAGGDAPHELIRRLSYQRYLQERFRHVDVRRIYSEQGLSLVRNAAP